jgi:hypothetical protein
MAKHPPGTAISVAKKKRRVAVQSCTDHCAGCDRHFHGLGAFDAHRVDGACKEPSRVKVTKRDNTKVQALQVWTTAGICRLGRRGVVTEPVTVWQVWQSPAALASLARLKERKEASL